MAHHHRFAPVEFRFRPENDEDVIAQSSWREGYTLNEDFDRLDTPSRCSITVNAPMWESRTFVQRRLVILAAMRFEHRLHPGKSRD